MVMVRWRSRRDVVRLFHIRFFCRRQNPSWLDCGAVRRLSLHFHSFYAILPSASCLIAFLRQLFINIFTSMVSASSRVIMFRLRWCCLHMISGSAQSKIRGEMKPFAMILRLLVCLRQWGCFGFDSIDVGR